MAAHARLKNEFTEGERYYNLTGAQTFDDFQTVLLHYRLGSQCSRFRSVYDLFENLQNDSLLFLFPATNILEGKSDIFEEWREKFFKTWKV